MNKRIAGLIVTISTLLLLPISASAAASCDQYPGDTWIYGGLTSAIKPNVLIIIDTSQSMGNNGDGNSEYKRETTYPVIPGACKNAGGQAVDCSATRVYVMNSDGTWTDNGGSLSSVTTSCDGKDPRSLLTEKGIYTGRKLTTSGSCTSSGSGTGTYATGNYINWKSGTTTLTPKIEIARQVVKDLISTTMGVNFGIMVFRSNNEGSTFYTFPATGSPSYTSTIKDMDKCSVDPTATTCTATNPSNRDALLASINTTTIVANSSTPLAESLYEAGLYFRGAASAFGNTIGITNGKYTSPITSSCQKNYIIFVTDGMSTADDNAVLKTVCPSSNTACDGDYDGDGKESSSNLSHSLDDVAKYLYDTDLLPDNTATGYEYTIGKQNITTFTIGFGLALADAAAVALLQSAADQYHGHGASYIAGNQSALTSSLTQIMSSILSVDSSFVAPVVPVSPDNRTYNSNRIYMGFFKPINQSYWEGNLKKFGLDANNNLLDKNGNPANWVDENNDRIDDNTGATLPASASNGSFRATSASYWSTVVDAGNVNSGGVGDLLLLRDFATNPRKLYTYTGTSTDLTVASNAFSKANTAITATGADTATTRTLNVADSAAKDKLIDFMYGIDTYDEDANGNTTEKRGWLLGDILHSKPLVVNYAYYSTSTGSNESDCNINKSIIYVGSNDGMLHAFKDCDGSEAWAFIPPEVLPNLKEIPGQVHTYTVDASPVAYIYDANKNGTIETSTDKVILMIGMRRGGGPGPSPAAASKGSYYTLDVTDPTAPKYLWSLSNATTGFTELAESWAEPKIVKMKVGTAAKVVALIPGGYDNMNEDSRFGAIQTFTEDGTISNTTNGAGNVTSTGVSSPATPSIKKGRGIYGVEIASLTDTGVPTISTSPTRVWGVVSGASTNYATAPATDANMKFSFTSDITALDIDDNTYVDRLYLTDLGGNLWRFDVGNITSTTSGTGTIIFSANPSSGDSGRKLFFKPVVSLELTTSTSSRGRDAVILMGSGDREHPNNTAVLDRIYSIRDKGQTTAITESTQSVPVSPTCPTDTAAELNLIDMTTDQLQSSSVTNSNAVTNPLCPTVNSSEYWLQKLNYTSNYGWYIKLDRKQDSPNQTLNAGEKVLASPALFNGIAYFTTFTPGSSTNTDPCQPSNLGTSRLYVLNYATGEAVMNFCNVNANNHCDSNTITDSGANNDSTTPISKRAKSGTNILLRSDRSKTLGSGISSAPVLVRGKVITGTGGSMNFGTTISKSAVKNRYWIQK